MEKAVFEKALKGFIEASPDNFVKKEIALRPELAGMKIFDGPLAGYAAADDRFFEEAKKPDVIGPHFITPRGWLPAAETVIAVFLPFTAEVRSANRRNMSWPADEWLHARIEGQSFQENICRFIDGFLKKDGFSSAVPLLDSRFSTAGLLSNDITAQEYYTSNWSERHAAYAAGLGTFGLSKGLITRKGVAGRFLSVVTSAPFEPDKRPYTGVYDYCVNCGACVRNCPAKAILKEKGKLHYPCKVFLDSTREKHKPRYGCGKCQVKVPCEDKAPGLV